MQFVGFLMRRLIYKLKLTKAESITIKKIFAVYFTFFFCIPFSDQIYCYLMVSLFHIMQTRGLFWLQIQKYHETKLLIQLKRYIRKTCPCNEYPLKPHFYIVKLGYAGVDLLFLFLLQNIDCGYSLEPPRRGCSNVYPQSMF